MDPASRKKTLLIVLLAVVLVLPFLMASSWGLGIIEDYACEHAPADWAADLDLDVAWFYGMSLRPEKKKEVCERFLETFKTHPQRGYATFMIATAIEADRDASRQSAAQAYEFFLYQYGDDANSKEYVPEAERAVLRLRNR